MADQQRGSFEDHEAIANAAKRIKVAELKAILKEFNDTQSNVMRHNTTANKPVLIERVHQHMDLLKQRNDIRGYLVAKAIIEKYYGSTITAAGQRAALRRTAYPAFQTAPAQPLRATPGYAYGEQNGAQYANRGMPHGYAYGMATHGMAQSPAQVRWPNFRSSPFFKVKEWIAQQEITPRLRDPDAKLQTTLRVSLNESQVVELSKPDVNLRLFCAPSLAFNTSANPAHPAVVEFPIHTDVKVNDVVLSVNFRGKKTAAKVLPPNLNKDKRLQLRAHYMNRIDLICQKIDRGYIMAAAICDSRSVESLAENVSKNKVKTKEAVLSEMQKAAEDDDIEIGDADIGLKCPLSYMRLQMPARSSICSHTQCFDALSFFSVNEQTPSWQCPTCQKSIDPDTLFLDGYMLDILKRVPESVDVVTIDNQGRWRTSDGKYKSDDTASGAETSLPTKQNGHNGTSTTPQKSSDQTRVKGEDEGSLPSTRATPALAGLSRGQKHIEVLDLDDDEDEGSSEAAAPDTSAASSSVQGNGSLARVPSPLASGLPSSEDSMNLQRAETSGTRAHPCIDLTLSDSEDEGATPPARPQPTRLLAPLPPVGPYRGSSATAHRPANGASSPAWEHIDRLGAASGSRTPIYGGTFGQPHFGERSSISSGQQTLVDSWRARNHASSSNSSPAPMAQATSSATASSPYQPPAASAAQPASNAQSSPPLAHRLGQQVADPYQDLHHTSTSADSHPVQPPDSREESSVGDDSGMPARARKRPRRNSVLLGREEEEDGSSEEDDIATPERPAEHGDELHGIDFDDFELELEAEAGLADDVEQPAVGQPGKDLANRLGSAPVQAAATNGHQSDDGESSDGLQEDERAGLF